MVKCSDTHLEIEHGWPISVEEYDEFPAKLKKRGFKFARRLLITDFILPMVFTNRLRIVRAWEDGGREHQHYIRCLKSHPLKGTELEDIRKEQERNLRWRQAQGFVIRAIDFLRAPVPHYSKVRDEYEGEYAGGLTTVARDRAVGLGEKSGRFLEVEATRNVSFDRRAAVKLNDNIADLGHSLLGDKRKNKSSYRKMLMSSIKHGEEIICDDAVHALMRQYQELLPKIRDASSLNELERLGTQLRRAGIRALRSSAA
jgi:hypothetical protein